MRNLSRTWGLLPAMYIVMGVGVATAAETLGHAAVAGGAIIHVDAGATGGNDGSSWCDAYRNPQDALIAAVPGDTIRVAQGTYTPDGGYTPVGGAHAPGGADRTATFRLVSGVTLQGGYAGCGQPNPNVRDINAFETILSGDLSGNDVPVACTQDSDCTVIIGGYTHRRCADDGYCIIADDNDENSYHVVTGSGTDGSAILDGFTITAGNANSGSFPYKHGGGMFNNGGSPTVTNCTFRGNSANEDGGGMRNFVNSNPTVTNCTFNGNSASFGGGMYNSPYSNPAVTNCTFSGNSAGASGAGMYNDRSSPAVTDCAFSDNSATIGGGMFNEDSSNPTVTNCTFSANSGIRGGGMYNTGSSNPAVSNCTFSGNTATDFGGGMYNTFGSSPAVTNCAFNDNFANSSGGGMHNGSGSPIVTHCTFSGNRGADYGGGMYNAFSSDPTVSDCTFSGNSAGAGGGMYNTDFVSPAVNNCTFSGNSADGIYSSSTGGGGMYNTSSSSPTVTNCTFIGNSATSGGGMYNRFSDNPTVSDCTFSGNSAGAGGGMHNTGSNLAVTNCTFSGNSTRDGGGMGNESGSSPTVTNCTFSGNSANRSGGGMCNSDSSSPAVNNCILWANLPTQIATFSGTPVVNYSIVQGGWFRIGAVGVVDADPLFVDPDGPDDVFGTEDDDLRLMPGSPAIDAGSNAAVPPDMGDLDDDGDTDEPTPLDLDGNPRFVDDPGSPDCPHGGDCGTAPVVDMGAFEFFCAFSGDADGDADVDLDDFLEFLDCAADAPAAACTDFDADCDGDVNLFDFSGFQRAFTGP